MAYILTISIVAVFYMQTIAPLLGDFNDKHK